MQKINPLISNINFQTQKRKPKEQFFGNYYTQNYAPMPVYTQIPYGIQQRNYIKLGVDRLPNGQEIHIYRLSNGQKVQIIKKEGGTSILTKVNTGSFDEKGHPKGIAHFIEHSVFHGSKKYNTDLMNKLNKISTFNNASTSSKETTYYMDLSSDSIEDLNYALDIQSDMLLNPTFCSIEKEKPIVRAEYQRDMLDDENLTYEHLLKSLFQYSDTNEASIVGNNETINSITREDMFRFHSNFYKPSNMTTMITSKHNPDEIINIVANNFVPKTPKNCSPTIRQPISMLDKTTRTDLITNNSSDGTVFVSFVCPNLANSFDKLKLETLCSIFASRYLASISLEMQNASIGLITCKEILNEKLQSNEGIQSLYQNIIDFSSKPPTEEEVKKAKETLLKNLDTCFNSGNISVMENILDIMNDGENYITYNAYRQMIESLTPQNIHEMIKYFDLNRAAIVVAHPKGTSKEQIQKLDKQYPYSIMPIDIASSNITVNYPFIEFQNQSTGDKFYSTTLADGSRLHIFDSPNEDCIIDWNLCSENYYVGNPASKFVLNCLYTQKLYAGGNYALQGKIYNQVNCKLEDLANEITRMKSFTHLELTQDSLTEAKKEALKFVDDMQVTAYKQFCESIFGSTYTTSKELLKEQINRLTLNDLVNDLNNMVTNSQSSYVVKAPIGKNPTLAQDVANLLNSPNIKFKQPTSTTKLEANSDFSDCVIYVNNANQNQITEGYNFKISGNPKDYYIFNLLSKILATKNHDKIREQMGLAYYSGAYYQQKSNQGMIILETEASCNEKGDLEKIFKQYQKNIDELANGQITSDELVLAKNQLKGYLKSCFDDKNDSLLDLIQGFAFDSNMLNAFRNANEIIDSISLEDIKNAANYAFKNKSQKIIIAKQEMLDAHKGYISTLGKTEKR